MKQPIQMRKPALLILASLAALAISSCHAAATTVRRMELTHADAGRGLSGRELMQRMAQRSKARAAGLLSSSSSATAPVSPGPYTDGVPSTEYIVNMAIGSPPQRVQLILDTGSDLTWTQCDPCPFCFDQELPYFRSSKSSTHKILSCDSKPCQHLYDRSPVSCGKKYWPEQSCVYIYSYGDKSVTTGFLESDNFTFGAGASVPEVAFGCALVNHMSFESIGTGLAGFARGPLSLPSQLKLSNFSYCFTAINGSKPSTILLDLPANLYSENRGAVQTTPIIKNPENSNKYYLSLKGISVGSRRLPVPESEFALKNGTGGTIIDSGTSFTMLQPRFYWLVLDAFAAQVKLPAVSNNTTTDPLTCFSVPPRAKKPVVPKLVLHFEGATMEIPRENYVFEIEEAGNTTICLAIGEYKEMNIIGNFQQQNMHVLYDLRNNKLSFRAFLVAALLAAAVAISGCNAAATIRMQLTHADAGRGLAGRELMHRMALRSKARVARQLLSSASAPVTPGGLADGAPSSSEYLVHLAIGTPPQRVQLTLDTGSDLIWTQCAPCPACFDQALPYFDTSASSTFSLPSCDSTLCQGLPVASCGNPKFWPNQTCVYTYSYGDKSVTTGYLEADAFTFGASASVPGVAFGCGLFNSGVFKSNETGIAGFGRGPLSLPSQLRVSNFSHCFTAVSGSKPSTVLLDLPADLYRNGLGAVQTTPLIKNPDNPTLYYLSLKGITVGSTRLPVPESEFALNNGTGGTIIDSGTAITSLTPRVYRLVRDAFAAQVKLPVVPSNTTDSYLCFSVPPRTKKPDVPKLVLHLDGATMDLPRENYVFEVEDAGNSIVCLAILEGETTIIGNFQQQNMHVLYDLQNSRLSFVPAQCDKL
uniref:Peptidase A1 domain-containing protein n=1 Tax=Leersia perrieri TaxID=77586 RepID=A0A0D9VTD6_9ORYZ